MSKYQIANLIDDWDKIRVRSGRGTMKAYEAKKMVRVLSRAWVTI